MSLNSYKKRRTSHGKLKESETRRIVNNEVNSLASVAALPIEQIMSVELSLLKDHNVSQLSLTLDARSTLLILCNGLVSK